MRTVGRVGRRKRRQPRRRGGSAFGFGNRHTSHATHGYTSPPNPKRAELLRYGLIYNYPSTREAEAAGLIRPHHTR